MTNDDTIVCARYICNLAFSDVLDPTKNHKFPGSIFSTLSRPDLKKLLGQPGIHKPYRSTDIIPWIQPVERQTPPTIDLQHTHETVSLHTGGGSYDKQIIFAQKARDLDTDKLDFGYSHAKLFEFMTPIHILISDIDFGGSDGLFSI